MDIAPDPKSDIVTDNDTAFDDAFAEFASGKKSDPPEAKDDEDGQSDGNGPEKDAAAPEAEDDKSKKPAAEQEPDPKAATSDDVEKPDGGTPAPKADDNQAPDPWASVDPALKAQFDALKKERDDAVHRASSDANRVAALSRKVRELSTPQAPPAQKAAEPSEAEKALQAKISKLREDYGEIADPIIELMEAQKKELTGVATQLQNLSASQQQAVIERETQALDTMHPDWRQIAQSPEFAGWMEVQPANIQRLASSWDARETSVALTLFKAERAEAAGQHQQAATPEKKDEPPAKQPDPATDAKRSQQLDGGRDVRSKPAPAASGPPEDFDAAFDHFVAKQQAQKAAHQRR